MKSAVIKTEGKQYLVQEGVSLKVEKLPQAAGQTVDFKEVLLTTTDKTTKLGSPTITGAKVSAKIVQHGRTKKVMGVKMKAKKRNRKLFSHRQSFTEVEITAIKTK